MNNTSKLWALKGKFCSEKNVANSPDGIESAGLRGLLSHTKPAWDNRSELLKPVKSIEPGIIINIAIIGCFHCIANIQKI